MRKLLYIFFLINLSIIGYTQNPAYFKIGEDEFANSNIYTLLFDEIEEVLYVGTNNGLYVYKQNRFIKIIKSKEQKGGSVFDLKQNNKGEIFCHNLIGQLFKVSQDSLSLTYQTPLNESLTSFSYFFMDNNDIIVGNSDNVKLIDQTGEIKEVIIEKMYFQDDKAKSYISSVSQTKDGAIFIVFQGRREVVVYDKGEIKVENFEFENKEASTRFFILNDRLLSVCKGGNVNSSSPYLFQNYTPENKEQVYQFSSDELIGLNQRKGVHFLKQSNDTLFESQHFFDNTFTSTYCKKNNGTLFFGTFNDGIYVVPDRHSLRSSYTYLFQGITVSNSGELYISSREGKVFKFDKELTIVGSENINIDNVYTFYGDFKFEDIKEPGLIYSTPNNFNMSIKDITQINKNTLIVATRNNIFVTISDSSVALNDINYIGIHSQNNWFNVYNSKRCYATTWNENDSIIYIATRFGVFGKEWTTSKTEQLFFQGKTLVCNDLEFYNNQLICASEEDGILIFENNKFISQLTLSNGLKSINIEKIVAKNNLLFILTKDGMQLFDLKKNQFIELGIQKGNIHTDIINFAVSEDKLWLLQKHSFYSYNLNDLGRKYNVAKLYLDSITVDDSVMKLLDNQRFDYDQNAFSFYYDYRNIETKPETVIEYTLEGFYDEWKTASTSDNVIRFEYLPPGRYSFKICANFKGQKTKIEVYRFMIKLPFWQTWWFILISIISLIGLITIYYKRRIAKIKKRENERHEKQKLLTDTIDAKLKALRSQMNPHFIFNSLNSIQAFILKQDTEKSYDYVVMFSDLVRKTLQYSDVDYINIDDELNFLTNYLSLESLRMKDEFNYTINYSGNKGIKIPSLMVQPFIENAIHHGLMHRNGLKTLDIYFEFGEEMKCTIIDNGIGREKASTIRKRQNSGHKSFSLEATKQRMIMLNKQHGDKATYEIIDLFENNNPSGTKVIMTLPFIFEY